VPTVDTYRLLTDYHGGLVYKNYQFIRTQQRSRPKGRGHNAHNWRDPWKNRISSTSKLRKSLVKTVTRRNISSCSVLPPEIVMHDAFNVILWTWTSAYMHRHAWRSRVKEPNNTFELVWTAGCSRLDIRLIY